MIKRLIFDVDNILITKVDFRDAIRKTLMELGIYSDKRLNIFIKEIDSYGEVYNNYNKKDYTQYGWRN